MSPVLSDGPGAPGQRLIQALIAGERDPRTWAAFRHDRWQKDAEDMARAWTGTWREAPLLVRTHALARCDFYTAQLHECAVHIAQAFAVIKPCCEATADIPLAPPPAAPPRRTPHSPRKNAPAGATRAHLLRIPGVARVAVHGISASMAQTMVSESGTDMGQWPDDTQLCSGLGLAPQQAISGGKVRTSRTRKNRHRAAPACRMATQSVLRADWAWGACSRRVKGRLGPAQALVAPAHQIARTVYHMLQDRVPSHAVGSLEYNPRCRERALQSLQKQAATLGSKLALAAVSA